MLLFLTKTKEFVSAIHICSFGYGIEPCYSAESAIRFSPRFAEIMCECLCASGYSCEVVSYG